MIVFVDYEHADGYRTEIGERILAARTRLTYRFEDLSDLPCFLVRYNRVTPELLDRVGATVLFISGATSNPPQYEPAAVRPLVDIIRTTRLPMLGLCGGFQLIAQALGAELEPLPGPAPDGGVGDDGQSNGVGDGRIFVRDDGSLYERGYHPVTLVASHPVLAGLGPDPVFRHSHGLHVPVSPQGFTTLASSANTPVQMAVHDERHILGTQFHPEYWTDEHPDGRTLIANFLRWSGVTG